MDWLGHIVGHDRRKSEGECLPQLMLSYLTPE